DFLTGAFRAAGAMGADNRVTVITHLEPFTGGSTGRKALLSVAYDHTEPHLPEDLFVKFSRDLDDELRDRGRRQMESEVRFGLLSQIPDFPVAVPRCLFGEYHLESGSGVLVSERIAFGVDGIEPHHPKARDYEIDDLLAHYDALLSAVARLAGSHRAGRFPAEVMAHFEPRPRKVRTGGRPSVTPDQIRERVLRYADFVARFPQLLPASIRSAAFIDHLLEEAPRAIEHADALRAAVRAGAQELTAFCHWNANIDNAWYWRDERGDLACGLMDWGNVGQMHMVTAITSCLAFAEPDFVIEHLDHFFARFSEVFEEAGGGALDPDVLGKQFALHMVVGGLQWPLDTVPLIERHVPDLAGVADRFDPRIRDDEFARTQLHLLAGYLMLWQASDARGVVDDAIRRAS
ncbi:MAG: hypothetical protein JO291_06775, partial [Acidimicrobiia bacterium]|nr:hypothetical protein [Acidimicrobiia bacterium]